MDLKEKMKFYQQILKRYDSKNNDYEKATKLLLSKYRDVMVKFHFCGNVLIRSK